jgi:bifunctional non-homologous end joining protein LigD
VNDEPGSTAVLPPSAVPAPQPREVEPQLAVSSTPLEASEWLYERKLDGVRCLVHVAGDEVRLQSRHHHPYAARFPELVEAVRASAREDLVADGEIVAFDGEATSFGRLQTRIASERARTEVGVHLYLFDLIHLGGHDLRPVPLEERKPLLHRALRFADPLRFTDHERAPIDQQPRLLEQACARGWEGLIAKAPRARYRSGRSTAWRKLPCLFREDLAVVGFTPASRSRIGFGALLLGKEEAGHRRYVGKVGTGFDEAHLTTIRTFLERIEIATPPVIDPPRERGARWVEPVVHVRVAFTGWTAAGRLRHPRFLHVVVADE